MYNPAMPSLQAAARTAGALADPVRLALLAALMEGEATVSDLAARLALAQPRISTHLARLRAAGLVTTTVMGRHHAYRVAAAEVKPLLDALYARGPAAVTSPSRQAGRERREDTPLRRARTCYDHLAGVAGVALLDGMQTRGWVTAAVKDGPAYTLTAGGARALARRGVDVEAARTSRRRFASACLDWTERRPHLGGALAAEILDALRAGGYVQRRPRGRDVRITKPLTRWLAR
jgi:DNA-binding transcriptional ArsR family regulator